MNIKAILFDGAGMVGAGILHEALNNPRRRRRLSQKNLRVRGHNAIVAKEAGRQRLTKGAARWFFTMG